MVLTGTWSYYPLPWSVSRSHTVMPLSCSAYSKFLQKYRKPPDNFIFQYSVPRPSYFTQCNLATQWVCIGNDDDTLRVLLCKAPRAPVVSRHSKCDWFYSIRFQSIVTLHGNRHMSRPCSQYILLFYFRKTSYQFLRNYIINRSITIDFINTSLPIIDTVTLYSPYFLTSAIRTSPQYVPILRAPPLDGLLCKPVSVKAHSVITIHYPLTSWTPDER